MKRPVPLAALGLAALAACASLDAVSDAELPDAPIALYYRTPEEARRRADAIEDRRRTAGLEQAPRADGPHTVGRAARLRADLGALGAFFTSRLGLPETGPEAFPGRLALLDPRSRRLEVVAEARRGSVPLAWRADRARLLFAQPTPDGRDVQVYELDPARRTARRITRGPPWHTQSCYGPEGRIVVTAFEAGGEAPVSRLRISGPGGRGPYVDLTAGPADHSPSCAPDGAAVVFERRGPRGGGEIWLATREDGELRRLGPGHQPRFGARGDWVVYAAVRDGMLRLFRVRPDGSGRAPIAPGGRGGRDETRPTASPDGSLVAYVASEVPLRSQLYVRRFDGSGDRILFADGDADVPVW